MQRIPESAGRPVLRAMILAGLMITSPAWGQSGEGGPPEVSGAVEALERDTLSIIVDGRRFQLASTVDFDGSDVEAAQALKLLAEGDEVQLLDVEWSHEKVTRIRTRLQ